MKGKKHYSAEQITKFLSEANTRINAGQTIAQVCQALGIAESTFHRWRALYGGMSSEESNMLKTLEKENTRLKRMVAELMLDKEMLKELAKGNF